MPVFAAGSSSTSGSGSHSDGTHTLGIEGAINIASASGAAGTATNFVGGVYLDWKLTDMFYFRPEILYLGGTPGFLSLPLMVSAKFDTGSIVHPYVFLGPEFQLKVGTSATASSFNFGIGGGAGADFDIASNFVIGANVRYVLGLTNQINTTVVPGASSKSRGIYILATIGYRL